MHQIAAASADACRAEDRAERAVVARPCKTCRHIVLDDDAAPGWQQIKFARCGLASLPNYVLGETYLSYCEVERQPRRPCGPEGKLWQAAPDKRSLDKIYRDGLEGREGDPDHDSHAAGAEFEDAE